ncbi:MAG: hypothetical protein KAS97_09430, partial [Candidatus Aminicenantes bacterium]|nr:hypothetical protein [Candidatus Aminicenantes bacterium]
KIVFSVLTIIISIFFITKTLSFEQKLDPGKYKSPVFQITGVSENSKLFQDLSLETPLTVSDTSFTKNLRIKTDSQTSFEFLYKGSLLNVLPDSYVYYHPRREALSLISGELYWVKSSNSPIQFYTEEDKAPITISFSGRIRKSPDGSLTIWSYKGESVLKDNGDFINIPSGQCLVIDSKKKQKFSLIPKATTYIAPEKKSVQISKFTDFLVKIDWRIVPGVTEYKVKLYPSPLRESILLEKVVALNRTGLDLEEFEQNREFYWEIIPLNEEKVEGEPSRMGQIKLFGVLISQERDSRPPELAITSMTVNGNMVLIRGDADINSELFVDGNAIKIDSNGIFIYTKRYKTLGLKQIIFRIVSPSGVESIQTKQVTIYEE